MHVGSETRSIGRYIVDIDGCLRATDKPFLSPCDVLALRRETDMQASVIWEINGESILLGAADRIEMDEDRVAFFRTCTVERLFLNPFADASLGSGRWSDEGVQALAA